MNSPYKNDLKEMNGVDFSLLTDWYVTQAKKNKRGLIVDIVFCILVTIITGFTASAVISNSNADKDLRERFHSDLPIVVDNPNVEIQNGNIIFFILLASLVSLLYPFIIEDNRLQTVSYTKIERDKFLHIWRIVDAYLEKLNLTSYKVNIYYLKTNSYEAHVSKKDQIISLYISRVLLSHYSQNNADVEAIIAHELGHVFQGDTKLLILSGRILILPVTLVIIAAIILILTLGLSGVKFSGFFGIIITTFFKLVNRRRKAENLADMASFILTRDSSIINVVNKLTTDNAAFWYPSKVERVDFINNTIKKFSRV